MIAIVLIIIAIIIITIIITIIIMITITAIIISRWVDTGLYRVPGSLGIRQAEQRLHSRGDDHHHDVAGNGGDGDGDDNDDDFFPFSVDAAAVASTSQ